MKLILKDAQQLTIDSMNSTIVRDGIRERDATEIRIYDCEKSLSELKALLSDDNLSEFKIQLDSGKQRQMNGWAFYRAVENWSDTGVFTTITLYLVDDVTEIIELGL